MTTAAPSRQHLINANRFSFLAAGFGIAAWAPMIPIIKERFGLDEYQLGLLLLCVGAGSLVSMPLSGMLSSRFGCRKPVYVAGVLMGVLLLAVALSHSLYLTALLLVLFGMVAVILDVVSNINAALLEERTGLSIMSGLHGMYSVGGFLGSLSVTALLSVRLSLSLTAAYALCCMLFFTLFGCRFLLESVKRKSEGEAADKSAADDSADTADSADTSAALKSAQEGSEGDSAARTGAGKGLGMYFNPVVLCIGVMCFIMFQTEGSMLDWSGVFLHQERGVDVAHAGYGYAAFAVMMTVIRLTGDKIVRRLGRRRVIVTGTLFIVAGFTLAVAVEHYAAALAGFCLIGLGAGNVVPQLISVAAAVREVPVHISVTVVNTIGFTGILCGPALLGFLAHTISLPYTYLCQAAAVFGVTALSLVLLRREKDANSADDDGAR